MRERPPTIALYLRVSTRRQAQEGTIETQRVVLRALAERRGLRIVAEFADEGKSGTLPPEKRPGLRDLLAFCLAHQPGQIGTYDLSRLSRADRLEQAKLQDLLRRTGCLIVTNTGDVDLTTRTGRLLADVQGAVNAYAREDILEKTLDGQKRAIAEGRWIGGRAPFGYRYDRNARRLVEHPEEAAVIRRVFAMAADLSVSQIADQLNAEGVRTHGTSRWTPGTVYRLLRKPTYAGTYAWGATRGHVVAPREAAQEGSVVALVTREEWQAAQAALSRRRSERPGKGRRKYLLVGLVRCGAPLADGTVCGKAWSGTAGNSKGGRKHHYYRCLRAMPAQARRYGLDPCGSHYLQAEQLESFVWEEVSRLIRDPILLARAIAQKEADADEAKDHTAEIREIEARRAGLLEALARAGTGILQGLALQVTVARVEADVAAVDARLQALRHARARREARLAAAAQFAAAVRDLPADPTWEERRRILVSLFVHPGAGIWVEPGGGVRFRGMLLLDRAEEGQGFEAAAAR